MSSLAHAQHLAAAGRYHDGMGRLVVALKERGALSLVPALGDALAAAVGRLLADAPSAGAVRLVPVPASPEAIHERHFDHTALLARRACRRLRGTGVDARVVPALRHIGGRRDQASLTRHDRVRNVSGAFTARGTHRVRRRLQRPYLAVVVDDVWTTGATAAAAVATLESAGVTVAGVAVLAVAASSGRPQGRRLAWGSVGGRVCSVRAAP